MNLKSRKIIVDLMSGETGPLETFRGVLRFAKEFTNWECIIIANNEFLKKRINQIPKNVSTLVSNSIISMEENDPLSFRRKVDSSLSIGIKALVSKKGDALVSSANTMAYVSGIFLSSKPLVKDLKPAIAVSLPTNKNVSKTVLDAGAFVNRQAKDFVDLAILGQCYHRIIFDIKNPCLALISNGIEEFKGDEVTKQAHNLLKKEKRFNYYGLVEPTTIFGNDYHVLIGDGFAINILGKTIIATSKFVKSKLKETLTKNLWRKVNGFFLKKAFKELKTNLFSNEMLGAGMILGIEDLAFKSPGKTYEKGYYNSLILVKKILEKNMITEMKKGLEKNGK